MVTIVFRVAKIIMLAVDENVNLNYLGNKSMHFFLISVALKLALKREGFLFF